jgi:hypothetical protein
MQLDVPPAEERGAAEGVGAVMAGEQWGEFLGRVRDPTATGAPGRA